MLRFDSAVAGAITSNPIVNIGGMEFVSFAGGKGRIGSPDFPNNPVRDFAAKPVLVGRDLVPNSEMDAYIAAMGEETHALVAKEANGRLHLLGRGRPQDEIEEYKPVQRIIGDPALVWGALTSITRVRVVPPADRLQDLSRKEFALPNHPATRVNLFDGLGFCAWRSEMTGHEQFILDEETWEWIATGGQGPDRKCPWGNEEPTAAVAHFNQGLNGTTAPIGSQRESREGVRDLSGNLFELTMSKLNNTDPWYVLRGGSWNIFSPQNSCAAYRNFYYPGRRSGLVGFRVAASPQDSR